MNFGNVEYLSSAALGKRITLNKKLQAVGGGLILCNIDPQIYEVFEITKLNKVFNIPTEGRTGGLAGVLIHGVPGACRPGVARARFSQRGLGDASGERTRPTARHIRAARRTLEDDAPSR